MNPRPDNAQIAFKAYEDTLNHHRVLEPDFQFESNYLNVLRQGNKALSSLYEAEEITRRCELASSSGLLIRILTSYRAGLNMPFKPSRPAMAAEAKKQFKATSLLYKGDHDLVYRHAKDFIQAVLVAHRVDKELVDLASDLGRQLVELYNQSSLNFGEEKIKLLMSALNESKAKLALHLETSALTYYTKSSGRLLLGTLEALLGAALILVSLTAGLALTLAVAASTRLCAEKTHWGPLSWGNGLFQSGINLAQSGPTFFQRGQAQALNADLEKLQSRVTEIQIQILK